MDRKTPVTNSTPKRPRPCILSRILNNTPPIFSIISIFHKQNTFEKRERRRLQKPPKLEAARRKDEQGSIAQTLPLNGGIECEYLQGELLQNYDRYIDMLKIRNLPKFRWCLNAQCSAGQVHNKGKHNLRVICRACKSESCFTHQVPLVKGKRCKACDVSMAADKIALAGSKPCPRCKAPTILEPIRCGSVTCICNRTWKWGKK
ncbi:E3 ubiquitin-protein ligase rnf19b [Ciborinia camelliae]|nr:E3 ubiquitin-protein ligase rnf19b [Ciborinia camelliae]